MDEIYQLFITICNKSETSRESKCVHCDINSSADVSIAIKKLKSDIVNDNGLYILIPDSSVFQQL